MSFTELEMFEARPGTVIFKGASQLGSMTIGAINVVVVGKDSTEVTTGRKEYGLTVEFKVNGQRGVRMLVDHDEKDPLLNSLNFPAQIDSNVTALPSFVASYVTRSGLHIGAYTSQKRCAIQLFLQDRNINGGRILITSARLAQFRNFMGLAKKNLDSLRSSS